MPDIQIISSEAEIKCKVKKEEIAKFYRKKRKLISPILSDLNWRFGDFKISCLKNYNGFSIIISCACVCAYFNNNFDDDCDFDNYEYNYYDYNYNHYDYDCDNDIENYYYDHFISYLILNSILTDVSFYIGSFYHFLYGRTYFCQGLKYPKHICLSQWGIHNWHLWRI